MFFIVSGTVYLSLYYIYLVLALRLLLRASRVFLLRRTTTRNQRKKYLLPGKNYLKNHLYTETFFTNELKIYLTSVLKLLLQFYFNLITVLQLFRYGSYNLPNLIYTLDVRRLSQDTMVIPLCSRVCRISRLVKNTIL